MKPEIKKLWIEDLRSGKFKQGTGKLQSNGEHCCLDLLMMRAVEAGVVAMIPGYYSDDLTTYVTENPDGKTKEEHYSLVHEVITWAGLPADDFEGSLPEQVEITMFNDGVECVETHSSLVSLNDEARYTFEQIADVIEAQF